MNKKGNKICKKLFTSILALGMIAVIGIIALSPGGHWMGSIAKGSLTSDIIPPEIINVLDYPDPQEASKVVHILCEVIDNEGEVDTVIVNIAYPDGSIVNETMKNIPDTDFYYHNATYINLGIYNYFIWASDSSGNVNTSASYYFTIRDTIKPEIIDTTPTIGYTGDSFTFSATVTDIVDVSRVYVEYWYGTGSHTNDSMNKVANDHWEKSITIENTLDKLHYIISANDTSNNWNNTGTRDVSIHDNDDPIINDNTPTDAYTGDSFTFNAIVTDNIQVSTVLVEYWYGTGSHKSKSMNNVAGDHWENTITVKDTLDKLHYIISANDISNNWNDTDQKNVIVTDDDKPTISGVISSPLSQTVGGYVNIICNVKDNIEIDEVYLSITYPSGKHEKFSITQNKTGDIYYCNRIYNAIGTYHYFIWANDTSNNENNSKTYTFTIENRPPNNPSNPSPENNTTEVSIYSGLHWSGGDPDPGDTVTYDVYFGTSLFPPYKGTTSITSYSFTTLLSYNTTYYWKIVAKDNHDEITEGSIWNFRTQSAPPPPPPEATRPSPPRNLQATAGHDKVWLNWEEPLNNGSAAITDYKIYKGMATGSEVYLDIVKNITTYIDTGLDLHVTYYYRVSAINSVGEGDRSNEATAILIAPSELIPFKASKIISIIKTPQIKQGEEGKLEFRIMNPYPLVMSNVKLTAEIYHYVENSWFTERKSCKIGEVGFPPPKFIDTLSTTIGWNEISSDSTENVSLLINSPQEAEEGTFFIRFRLEFDYNNTRYLMKSIGCFTKEEWDAATKNNLYFGGVNISMLGVDGIIPETTFGVKCPMPLWPLYILIVITAFLGIVAVRSYMKPREIIEHLDDELVLTEKKMDELEKEKPRNYRKKINKLREYRNKLDIIQKNREKIGKYQKNLEDILVEISPPRKSIKEIKFIGPLLKKFRKLKKR